MSKANSIAVEAVVEMAKAGIRSQTLIPFHRDEIYLPFPARFKEQMGGTEPGSDARIREIVAAAAGITEEACPGLSLKVGANLYGLTLEVTGGTEWADALRYAHGTGERAAVGELSPAAAALLARIESGELTGEFRSELSVRHRIRFFGFNADFDKLLQEIRIKRGIEVEQMEKGERWIQRQHFVMFKVVSRSNPSEAPPCLNPILPNNAGRLPSRREFRRWFYQVLLAANFCGCSTQAFWRLASRREFFRCFPYRTEPGHPETDFVVRLLSAVRGRSMFDVGWDFGHTSCIWLVSVKPRNCWEDTYLAMKAEIDRPTPEVEFGLSSAAAALYEWLRELSSESLEMGLTPVLESAVRDQQLLLDCPWSKENFNLYVRLLCEEISERAPLQVAVVDWHEGGSIHHRIRVK